MLRKFLAALAVLLLCGSTAAQAAIVGPLPYTLTNGTTADAAQVMADLNKIVNDVNTNVIFPSFSQQNYYAADSGAANAMVVTLSPTPALYVAGMVVNVKVAVTNTGATTINANGLGAQNVVNLNGSALKGSQLLAGMTAQLVYDGSQFQLNSLSPSAVRQSSVSRTGSSFTASGAWTFTVPAGVYFVTAEGWGGGGGAGGAVASGYGAGGGAGGYGKLLLSVSPGDVLSGNIGASGAAGTVGGGVGGAGGTTTLLLNGVSQGSITGGTGGAGASGAGVASSVGTGGSATGSWVIAITGQSGSLGNAASIAGGLGGSAPRGGVGGAQGSGGGGNPGGGGGGAAGNAAGGLGGSGWVYLEY